jgi:hypothetical protein
LKPAFFALFIDTILSGPGVKVLIIVYEKNENHGIINPPLAYK